MNDFSCPICGELRSDLDIVAHVVVRHPENAHHVLQLKPTPKPDGWHTYHICNGIARELTWLHNPRYRSFTAQCGYCGEAFDGAIA